MVWKEQTDEKGYLGVRDPEILLSTMHVQSTALSFVLGG